MIEHLHINPRGTLSGKHTPTSEQLTKEISSNKHKNAKVMSEKLLITHVQKVKIEKLSDYSSKSYYLSVTIRMVLDEDEDVIGGRTDRKVLFYDDKNHQALFLELEKRAKADAGVDGDNKSLFKTVDKKTASKDAGQELSKPVKTYAYMATYRLPTGKMIERLNSKGGTNLSNEISVTCIGAKSKFDANGNVISDSWGESPLGIYTRMVNSGVLKIRSSVPVDASDFDTEGDPDDDE